MRVLLIIFLSGTFIFSSCNQEDEDLSAGDLQLAFEHFVDGNPAEFDTLIYKNEAGNTYEITNIQWFISDISLIDEEGNSFLLDGDDWIHYIDTDIPSSLTWYINEKVPAGTYSSIRFVFGIVGEKNEPNRFTDPPENNMLWPYPMGGEMGGYHYMKLNGFWLDLNEERTPFNFHLGVGQIYDENGEVTEFVQNWVEYNLDEPGFVMKAGEMLKATLRMNIENWFKNPHTYDHDLYGSRIMNNQEAMNKIKENGVDVFTLSINKNNEGKK